MSAQPDVVAKDVILALRGVQKTWSSTDRRFTLTVGELDLHPGEVISLTGESGSGKSTLLEMIGLVSRPDVAEQFVLYGRSGAKARTFDIAQLYARGSASALAGLRANHIGYVVQTGALLPFLTVAGNINLALEFAGDKDEGQVGWLLENLGLTGLENSYPEALSIGQRQRTAIARSLAHRPPIVLADEPTAALDPDNKTRVIEMLTELAVRMGATVIVATHEHELLTRPDTRRLHVVTELTQDGDIDHVFAEVTGALV